MPVSFVSGVGKQFHDNLHPVASPGLSWTRTSEDASPRSLAVPSCSFAGCVQFMRSVQSAQSFAVHPVLAVLAVRPPLQSTQTQSLQSWQSLQSTQTFQSLQSVHPCSPGNPCNLPSSCSPSAKTFLEHINMSFEHVLNSDLDSS